MTDMNEVVKTAAQYARQLAKAQTELNEAVDILKPIAKQQLELMRKILKELKLTEEYKHRGIMRAGWVELDVESYYWEEDTHPPKIFVTMWERGYCGDPDSECGGYTMSQHLIDGKPELFEEEYRKQLMAEADKAAKERELQRLKQIQRLENELKGLKG